MRPIERRERTAHRAEGEYVIVVREAGEPGIDEALAVHRSALAEHSDTYHARACDTEEQHARLQAGIRGVAVDAGRIIGTAQHAEQDGHVHLMGLAVHPAERNRGIARLLVEWVVQRALSLGYATVVTDTIEETGNVPLFEHLGFHVVQRTVTTQFDSDLVSELHMVKLERRLS